MQQNNNVSYPTQFNKINNSAQQQAQISYPPQQQYMQQQSFNFSNAQQNNLQPMPSFTISSNQQYQVPYIQQQAPIYQQYNVQQQQLNYSSGKSCVILESVPQYGMYLQN